MVIFNEKKFFSNTHALISRILRKGLKYLGHSFKGTPKKGLKNWEIRKTKVFLKSGVN